MRVWVQVNVERVSGRVASEEAVAGHLVGMLIGWLQRQELHPTLACTYVVTQVLPYSPE
jgi:hypothetical protein